MELFSKSAVLMAKQYVPVLEKKLCQRLENVHLNDGEEYPAIVLTNVDKKAKISLCAFASTECKRVLWTANATDIIEQILS